jgi:hypothetical protein
MVYMATVRNVYVLDMPNIGGSTLTIGRATILHTQRNIILNLNYNLMEQLINTSLTVNKPFDKKAYMKQYNATHKEQLNKNDKAYREANKPKIAEAKKKCYKANPELYAKLRRKSALKLRYGLTLQDYDNMLAAQQNRCGICGIHISELKEPIQVDHCHATGKVRGLLCRSCNIRLGEGNIGKFKVIDELYSKALGLITIGLN